MLRTSLRNVTQRYLSPFRGATRTATFPFFLLLLSIVTSLFTGCASFSRATTPCASDSQHPQRCQILQGDYLIQPAGAHLPHHRTRDVQGSLTIGPSPDLQHLQGLSALRLVAGDLYLVTLPALQSLSPLDGLVVHGEIHLIDLGVSTCEVDRWLATLGSPAPTRVVAFALADDHCAAPPSNLVFHLDQLPSTREISGGHLLEGLHPELRDRARLLFAILTWEGIDIVFISGHRPLDPAYRPNRLASWHNLGLAFDLNLVGRPYAYFEEDEPSWARIGELAAGLGLIWGRRFDDIFHFEWHPDYHARIRQHEFDRFVDIAGPRLQNHHLVFPLFDKTRVGQEDPPCFGGCQRIPVEDLRRILNALRE